MGEETGRSGEVSRGGPDGNTARALAEAARVFREVLERQAFLFAEPGEEGSPGPAEAEGVVLSLAFSGPVRGRLDLSLPRGLAVEIAANVLGTEPDDPEAGARAVDACRELLNVTCGNLVTALWGEGPVFDLAIPETLSASDWDAAAPGTIPFLVEDHPLLLRLRFEPDGDPGSAARPAETRR